MPWGMAFNAVPTGAGAAAASVAVGDNALASHSGDTSLEIATLSGRNWFFNKNPFADPYFFGRVVDSGPVYIVAGRAVFAPHAASSTNERTVIECGGMKITNIGNSLTFRVFANNVLQGTFAPLLDGTTEEYIEVAFKQDAVAGWIHVRINGAEKFRVSGVNVGSGSPTIVRYGTSYNGGSLTGTYWNDLYTTGSGASVRPAVDDIDAPGFWGPQVVSVLVQASDTLKEWTPDTGVDNYARVDEVPSDGDTSYVSTTTLGALDKGPASDLPPNINSITMVLRQCIAKAPDGGAPQIKLGVETSDGTLDGSARTIGGTSYATAQEVFMEKPGGGAWSIAKVNELVLRRTAA